MHPQRAQRWAVSDLNPFLWPLKGMADMVRANRVPRDNEGPMAAMERWTAAITSASWDFYRDLRDATVENTFFRTYGPASIGMAAEEKDTVCGRAHRRARILLWSRRRCRISRKATGRKPSSVRRSC